MTRPEFFRSVIDLPCRAGNSDLIVAHSAHRSGRRVDLSGACLQACLKHTPDACIEYYYLISTIRSEPRPLGDNSAARVHIQRRGHFNS